MNRYPIRSLLFLPLLRMGLKDEDWAIVLLASIVLLVILSVFEFNTAVPVPLVGAFVAFAAMVGVMRYLRDGKPPNWLQHNLQYLSRKALKPTAPGTYQEIWLKGENN
jgi:hypothetical protein